jgi:hypothetical protein
MLSVSLQLVRGQRLSKCNTGWWKSYVTHIKTFIGNWNSIKFACFNKHRVSLWLYNSPRRSRHVVTWTRQSVSCLQTVEAQENIFDYCTDFLLSNTAWHLVRTWFARMSLGITYIFRFSCVKQIHSNSSGEPFPWHRNSSPNYIKREEKGECKHRWTRWTLPELNIALLYVFLYQYNFFINITCARNESCVCFPLQTPSVAWKFTFHYSRCSSKHSWRLKYRRLWLKTP